MSRIPVRYSVFGILIALVITPSREPPVTATFGDL
jgi:hypothetical protein